MSKPNVQVGEDEEEKGRGERGLGNDRGERGKTE